MATERKQRLFTGVVVSDKMDKTIVVSISTAFKHPQFGKVMRKMKKYKVHDENAQAKVGDVVEFHETAPLSKTKYMRLVRVVETKN